MDIYNSSIIIYYLHRLYAASSSFRVELNIQVENCEYLHW